VTGAGGTPSASAKRCKCVNLRVNVCTGAIVSLLKNQLPSRELRQWKPMRRGAPEAKLVTPLFKWRCRSSVTSGRKARTARRNSTKAPAPPLRRKTIGSSTAGCSYSSGAAAGSIAQPMRVCGQAARKRCASGMPQTTSPMAPC